MPDVIATLVSYEYSIDRAAALELAAEVLRDQAQDIYVRVIAHLILDEYPTATHLELMPSDEREGYYESDLYAGAEVLVDDDQYVGDLGGAQRSTPTVSDLVRRLHSNDNWERFTELREDSIGNQSTLLDLRAALTGLAADR